MASSSRSTSPTRRHRAGAAGLPTPMLDSKERGFAFNFDFPNIGEQPFVPNAGNEKHRLVVNGIVDLPWDVKLSGLATYGSGAAVLRDRRASAASARATSASPAMSATCRTSCRSILRAAEGLQAVRRARASRLSAEVFNVLQPRQFRRRRRLHPCPRATPTSAFPTACRVRRAASSSAPRTASNDILRPRCRWRRGSIHPGGCRSLDDVDKT